MEIVQQRIKSLFIPYVPMLFVNHNVENFSNGKLGEMHAEAVANRLFLFFLYSYYCYCFSSWFFSVHCSVLSIYTQCLHTNIFKVMRRRTKFVFSTGCDAICFTFCVLKRKYDSI